jgi:hypothetical protein
MLKRRKVESRRHYTKRLRKKHAATLAKITTGDETERRRRQPSPDRKRVEPKVNPQLIDRFTGYKTGTKTDNESLVDEALEIYDGRISPTRRKTVHRRLQSQGRGMSPTLSSFNSLRNPGSESFSETETFSNYSFDSYNNEWTTRIVGTVTVTNNEPKPLPTTRQLDVKHSEGAKRNLMCCDFPTFPVSQWFLQRPRRQIPGMSIGEETKLWNAAVATTNATRSRPSSLIVVGDERDIDQIEVVPVEKDFQTKDSFNYAESKEDGVGMVFAPSGGRRRRRVPEPWWKRESWTDSSFLVEGTDGESRETFYTTDLLQARGQSGKMMEYSSALEKKVCDGDSSDLDESLDDRIARKNINKLQRRVQSQGRERNSHCESPTSEISRGLEVPFYDINQKLKGRSHVLSNNHKKDGLDTVVAVENTLKKAGSNITDATDLSELVRRSDTQRNYEGGNASKSYTIDIKTTNDASDSNSPRYLKERHEGISINGASRSASPIQFRGRPPYISTKNEKIKDEVAQTTRVSLLNSGVISETSIQEEFHSRHRGVPDSPILLYDASPYFQEISPMVEKKNASKNNTMKNLCADNSIIACATHSPSTSAHQDPSKTNQKNPEEKQIGSSDEYHEMNMSMHVEGTVLNQHFNPSDKSHKLKPSLHVRENVLRDSYRPTVKNHSESQVASPTGSAPKSPIRIFGDPPFFVGGDENGPLSCPRLVGTGRTPFLEQSVAEEGEFAVEGGITSQSRDSKVASPKQRYTPESNETSKSLNELKKLVTTLSPVKEGAGIVHDGTGVLLFRPTINIYNGTQKIQEEIFHDIINSPSKIFDEKPATAREEEYYNLRKLGDCEYANCRENDHPEVAIQLSYSGSSIDEELRQLAASEKLLRKELEEIQHRSAERRWQVKYSMPVSSTQEQFSANGRSLSEHYHQPRSTRLKDDLFNEPISPTNRKQSEGATSSLNDRKPKSPMRIYGDPPFFVDGPIHSPRGLGLTGSPGCGILSDQLKSGVREPFSRNKETLNVFRCNKDKETFPGREQILNFSGLSGKPQDNLSAPDRIIDLSKNSMRTSPSSIIDLSRIDGNSSPHLIKNEISGNQNNLNVGVFSMFDQSNTREQLNGLSVIYQYKQPDQDDRPAQNCSYTTDDAKGIIEMNLSDHCCMNNEIKRKHRVKEERWTDEIINADHEDILVPSLSNMETQRNTSKLGKTEEPPVEKEISWKSIQQLYNLKSPQDIEKKDSCLEISFAAHGSWKTKNHSIKKSHDIDRSSSGDSSDRFDVCSTNYSEKSITFLKPAEAFPNVISNQGRADQSKNQPGTHILSVHGKCSESQNHIQKTEKMSANKKSVHHFMQPLQTRKDDDCSDSVSSTSIFGGINVDPDDQSLFYALLRDEEFHSVTKDDIRPRKMMPRDAKTSELLNKILSRHGCLRTQTEIGGQSMPNHSTCISGIADENDKFGQSPRDVKTNAHMSTSPTPPRENDQDDILQSRIQRLRKLQSKLPSSMSERIRSTSVAKAEKPSPFSMKLTSARQRASKSLKQIRKNTNGDGIIEVFVQMDAPELTTRKREVSLNRERTGRELTLNVNPSKSKDLVQSLPRSARSRSVTSAKPGSLLWQAMAGRDK